MSTAPSAFTSGGHHAAAPAIFGCLPSLLPYCRASFGWAGLALLTFAAALFALRPAPPDCTIVVTGHSLTVSGCVGHRGAELLLQGLSSRFIRNHD
ncbi:TGB 3 [Mint virus X]|uniref:Movement protein TGBp3 n=3 Tax=Mint virus X TaxID=301865 RepID=Q5G7H0_9VIRU|nr:TGB 3 [Mint virus X]AAW67749.1 TGB 3 [Mint virus X]